MMDSSWMTRRRGLQSEWRRCRGRFIEGTGFSTRFGSGSSHTSVSIARRAMRPSCPPIGHRISPRLPAIVHLFPSTIKLSSATRAAPCRCFAPSLIRATASLEAPPSNASGLSSTFSEATALSAVSTDMQLETPPFSWFDAWYPVAFVK